MTDWNTIIKGCLNADKNCEQEMYRLFYAPMMKICVRYMRNTTDGGIVYNEAMLKVYQGLTRFSGIGNFEAWVKRIVINTCIDHCRKKARFSELKTTLLSEEANSFDPDIYDILSAKDIMRLIDLLPTNSALVFNLFVIEGFSHENIGKLLGIATGTSKWHLNEARRLLKKELDNLVKKEKIQDGK